MASEDEEDPFDVFGDDDESEQEDEKEATMIARSMVENVNKRLLEEAGTTVSTADRTSSETTASSEKAAEEDLQAIAHFTELNLQTWPPPLYKGNIMLVTELPFGGGRGYVAKTRLRPGSLILVEQAMMQWPTSQLGSKLDLISVRHLLEQAEASKQVQDMELFHPTKDDVDSVGDDDDYIEDDSNFKEQVSDMIHSIRQQFTHEQINQLVQLAHDRHITSRNGTKITSTDIIRMYLALRYNGLESDQPFSEVRTTRHVAAGESLTISYLPRVMSHSSRRFHLWEQHRFDIGANLTGQLLQLELVDGSLPPSAAHRWDPSTSVPKRIETATEELEKMLAESSRDITNGTAPPDAWEVVKALEVSSLELYSESAIQLKNESHIILIPCLSLHLEACQLVQQAPGLTTTAQLKILTRSVSTCRKLIALQQLCLGPDHFDLARTNLDLANAIAELLSRSRRNLPSLPSLSTFQEWSALERQSRKEHVRIKALYPHDALDLISRA